VLEKEESSVEVASLFVLDGDGARSGEEISLELDDGVSEGLEDSPVAAARNDDGISGCGVFEEGFSLGL